MKHHNVCLDFNVATLYEITLLALTWEKVVAKARGCPAESRFINVGVFDYGAGPEVSLLFFAPRSIVDNFLKTLEKEGAELELISSRSPHLMVCQIRRPPGSF